MKNLISKAILTTLVFLFSISIFSSLNAQSKSSTPKIYAVINRADWCPACQANGTKIMNEVLPGCNKLSVKFIANDLTNEQTIAKSSDDLKKLNVYNSVKETKKTGFILLVDAKSKKVVKEISVTLPTNEIVKQIKDSQI